MYRYTTPTLPVTIYAAKSGLDRHSAVILDEYGKELVSESY